MFYVTSSGITFYDDDGELLHTFSRSSGNNVVTFDITTETISESYVANVLSASNGIFNYTGGDAIISSYAGEKINLVANFTGVNSTSTDFLIGSSSGNLTIQNARDKIMDVAINNNTVAYAYMASGGGDLDGSSFSQFEVIFGGENSSNVITAGSGGSSLWGGSGGNDILTGGAGQDTFVFGKYDGADIINNASASDVVNLYDVSLSDITDNQIEGNKISATFNTGGSVQINFTENLSAKINFADGTSWRFNNEIHNWQSA